MRKGRGPTVYNRSERSAFRLMRNDYWAVSGAYLTHPLTEASLSSVYSLRFDELFPPTMDVETLTRGTWEARIAC